MHGIEVIVGRTPVDICQNFNPDEIVFTFSDGSRAVFYHAQDCCENVILDDVNGDWSDLIGNPILVADERQSKTSPDNLPSDVFLDESNTWTFYTFRGVGGSVDVRWHGSSNGYYSESVDFKWLPADKMTP